MTHIDIFGMENKRMDMEKNPFAINFGKLPSQYISRDILIDEITQELLAEEVQIPVLCSQGRAEQAKPSP